MQHERDRHKQGGSLITCSTCDTAGGTLLKYGDGDYRHQDITRCSAVMRLRQRNTLALPSTKDVMKYARPIKK